MEHGDESRPEPDAKPEVPRIDTARFSPEQRRALDDLARASARLDELATRAGRADGKYWKHYTRRLRWKKWLWRLRAGVLPLRRALAVWKAARRLKRQAHREKKAE
jgi:hypothetical protein